MATPGRRPPWSEAEILALVEAWAAAASARGQPLDAEILRALRRRTSVRRSLEGIRKKRGKLWRLFRRVHTFDDAQAARGEPAWFAQPHTSCQSLWKGGTITRRVFDSMTQFFGKPPALANLPEGWTPGDGVAESHKLQWSAGDLEALARSVAALCRSRSASSADGISERCKKELRAKYVAFGGLRSRSENAVIQQARRLLDAYRFIVAFNSQASAKSARAWHGLSERARASAILEYRGNSRLLQLLDAPTVAMLDKELSFAVDTSASKQKRSSSARGEQERAAGVKRARVQAANAHRATSRRRSSMGVDQKRDTGSGYVDDCDSSGSDCSQGAGDSGGPQDWVANSLRRRLRDRQGSSKGSSATETRDRETRQSLAQASPPEHSGYLSLLEHTVETMNAQTSELRRRITQTRIDGHRRALENVMDVCRRSSSLGPATSLLALEVLKYEAAVADLVRRKRGEERDQQ